MAGSPINGTAGDDTLTGTDGNDIIYGGNGSDTINGGKGADTIYGGTGSDTIYVSSGDTAYGDQGSDLFILQDLGETASNIHVDGGTGPDTLDLKNLAKVSDVKWNPSGTSGSVVMKNGATLTFVGIENIICFTPGTAIATPQGARAVETLVVGDRVVTRDHGLQPIRWIGKRTVPAFDRFAPIRIRPGVVTGQQADLLVSPQHRMLFQGYRAELLFGESEVLVAAHHLVDGHDVVQENCGTVTYIHILFDDHEIIYAEGAATESFHPGEVGLSAISDPDREELFSIFPALRSMPNSYGNTARRVLKRHEAGMIRI